MDSVKLPICMPTVRGYLNHAYQLSILEHIEEAKVWIYMNYIQLVSEIGNSQFPVTYYLPDYIGYNWSILTPWFDYQVITRDFVVEHNLDFHKLIKNAFSTKQYVFLYVNNKYIPNTPAAISQTDNNHHILLHGYDAATEEVYFQGYDSRRQFTERVIHIDQLKIAYFNNKYDYERYENRMFLLKVREDEGFKLDLDISHIIDQLISFRDSKRVIHNVFDYHSDFKYRYGLNVYDSLLENLRQFINGNTEQLRTKLTIPLHVIMEHKHLMVKRLRFIEKCYPDINLKESIDDMMLLKTTFEKLRNLTQKFEVTGNKEIIHRMVCTIEETGEKEYSMLTKLIHSLS
ncbi:hypothetical protein MKX50_09640 [Paenibacillus sp. FSL W8-0186]|uniref:hypothetical protein n=1 Tax=Paenibacillus TaxID=44249 RepID=UPI0030D281DD